MMCLLNALAMTLSLWAPPWQLVGFIFGACVLSLVHYFVALLAVLFLVFPRILLFEKT
jgi:hypothetical protein